MKYHTCLRKQCRVSGLEKREVMNGKVIPSVLDLYPSNRLALGATPEPRVSCAQDDPPEAAGPNNAIQSEPLLSASEQRELTDCERVITKGWQTFIEVGRALAQIRNKHLYRQEFPTFEAYCRKKWQYSRVHAHRLIAAAELHTHLLPIGNTPPQHETQLRPLMGLSKEEAKAAWKKALEAAKGGEVTAQLVKQAVAELKPDSHPPRKRRKSRAPLAPQNSSVAKTILALVENAERFVKVDQGPNAQNVLQLLKGIRENVSKLSA